MIAKAKAKPILLEVWIIIAFTLEVTVITIVIYDFNMFITETTGVSGRIRTLYHKIMCRVLYHWATEALYVLETLCTFCQNKLERLNRKHLHFREILRVPLGQAPAFALTLKYWTKDEMCDRAKHASLLFIMSKKFYNVGHLLSVFHLPDFKVSVYHFSA
jgi:hypothetical protein